MFWWMIVSFDMLQTALMEYEGGKAAVTYFKILWLHLEVLVQPQLEYHVCSLFARQEHSHIVIPALCLQTLFFMLHVFSSVQFIQFHQIHYKSKRPTGYRTSHSAIYIQILMHKDSIYKVIILIRASNKITWIYDHLIDWFNLVWLVDPFLQLYLLRTSSLKYAQLFYIEYLHDKT